MKKLVIFDFDGVLANTIELSYEIHKEANEDLTWKKFQDFSNGNFIDGIGKATEEGRHIIPSDFYSHYEKKVASLNIHDILNSTVVALAADHTVCIVSSTPSSYITSFFKKEGLEECFSDILGADVHQSKVVKIKMLLEKYNVLPKHAVLITDTLGDVREASECKVASVGVLWGLHEREMLELGNPVSIIDNPLLLLDAIKSALS